MSVAENFMKITRPKNKEQSTSWIFLFLLPLDPPRGSHYVGRTHESRGWKAVRKIRRACNIKSMVNGNVYIVIK